MVSKSLKGGGGGGGAEQNSLCQVYGYVLQTKAELSFTKVQKQFPNQELYSGTDSDFNSLLKNRIFFHNLALNIKNASEK